MKPKLLITGAGGFVAGSVICQGHSAWEIHGVDRVPVQTDLPGVHWHELDLLDPRGLKDLLDRIQPQVVIHTAAVADIDLCDRERDLSWKVNVELVRNLAEVCCRLSAKLLFTSTDTVFDGGKGQYTEEDIPEPVNYYGETKVAAEKIVTSMQTPWVLVRLSVVYGLPMIGQGNSFLAKMVQDLDAGKPVGFPQDEIRSPVDVVTVGRCLLELADSGQGEVFHLSGIETMARYEMGLRIADRWGYPRALIIAKNSGGIPGRAPRPHNVSLSNAKARARLATPMRTFEEGLDLIREMRDNSPS